MSVRVSLLGFFLPLVIGLSSGQALADAAVIYRWKDANGVTHFASTPPQGRSATKVEVPVGKPSSAAPRASGAEPPANTAHLLRETAMLREIDRLQNQVEGERQRARAVRAEQDFARQIADECERQRRVDCARPWVLQDYAPVPMHPILNHPAYPTHVVRGGWGGSVR